MDAKVILYLAAFNAIAPGAYAAPAPQNGILQPHQPERRDPQFPNMPNILPQLAPLPAVSVAPTVAVPVVVPTSVDVNNPLNSVLNALGTAVKSDLPAAGATVIALPKELVQPVTGALLKDPIAAFKLAYTSILNALLGGQSTLFGGSLTAPLGGVSSDLTNKLGQTLGSLFGSKGDVAAAADAAAGGGSLRKRNPGKEDPGFYTEKSSGSDTEYSSGSDTEYSSGSDTEECSESDTESSGSDTEGTGYDTWNNGYDTEDSGSDNEDSGSDHKKSGFGNKKSDFGNKKSDFGNKKSDFDNKKSGPDNKKSGFNDKKSGFDTEDSGSDTEGSGTDIDDNSSWIIPDSGKKHAEKRQIVPNTQILVPSAAVVPSGVSDAVAAIGSFAPLADATPLAVVPSSMAALAPDGSPATAIVPTVLINALADPDKNSLAASGTVNPLAPVPTELVPESAAAAIAAAASELPTPFKATIAEIAKSNGLQVRDVEDLKQGLDIATDPAAFINQWFAAQAKPFINELGKQIAAAPSILANIAAAQASGAAAPASIIAAQISAAKPILDSLPSIVQSQLAVVPTAAVPALAAASSLLDNLENASAGAGNPLAALVPDPSAIASAIAEELPVISATLDAGFSQATPTDSEPAVEATGGALVSDVASVGQDFVVTPTGPQPPVGQITVVPTVFPTVGLPIGLQLSNVLQPPSLLDQLFPSRVQLPSTLIPQRSSLAQPSTTPLQLYRPSIQQHPPLLLSFQLVSSLSHQRIPSVQPYPSAVQNQDTNSATGQVNAVVMAEMGTAAVPTPSTLPRVSEIPTTIPEEPADDDAGESAADNNNNIVDLLTQPLSANGIAQLLENQMYLQLAPLLLMLQSLAALSSNPTFTLSSSLLQDLLGSSSSSSSSSNDPASRLLDLLRPALPSSSSDPLSTPTTNTPSSSSSFPANVVVVDDPIASAWLAGAKLLQSNSLVNTQLMSPPNADDDDNDDNNILQPAGSSGRGGAPAIVANLLNTLLSSSSSAELTRNLAKKMSALAKWSADTQVAATRLGMDAWKELAEVLVS